MRVGNLKLAVLAGTAWLGVVAAAAPASATELIVEASLIGAGAGAGDTEVSVSGPNFTPSVSAGVTDGGASVWTSADLVSGSLRGAVNSLGTNRRGQFNASMSDQIFFHIDGAGASQITRLGLAISFEGAITTNGFPSSIALTTNLFSAQGQSGSRVVLSSSDFNPFYAQVGGAVFNNLAHDRPVPAGPISGRYDHVLTFDLVGADPEILFYAAVQGIDGGNGLLDFGNSAHFAFVLPENVTFTSGGGNSFTATGGVPEPATWAMLIAGFGLIGVAGRRRRSLVAA